MQSNEIDSSIKHDYPYQLLVNAYILMAVPSLLSFISCLILSLSIRLTLATWERTRFKFVFYLLAMYAVVSGATLFPTSYIKSKSLCDTQGFLLEFSGMSGILWTGFISIALHVKDYEERFTGKKFYIILIGITIFSAGISSIPLGMDFYAFGGNFCWIKNRNNDTATNGLRYGSFYCIVWTTMILIAVLHCYRYKLLGRATSEEGRKAFKVIRWYPAVTFICYVPVSISRLAQTGEVTIKDDETFAAYYILSSQIVRLLGFFNSIVYVFSDGAIEDLETKWDLCWKFMASRCKINRRQENSRCRQESAGITAVET
jgi:hypothetical protein